MSQASTRLDDLEARAEGIGRASPFSEWPHDVLLRLAGACSVTRSPSGTQLIVASGRCDSITIVAEGTAVSSVSSPGGRRVVFKFDNVPYAYGLFSLVDEQAQGHDLIADEPVVALRIPHVAVRRELQRMPFLWASVVIEVTRRARGMNLQMQQFVFDAPLVRAASLLLGMLATSGKGDERGPVAIEHRLSQERLAELLGTSRQWATALVRDLTESGIVEWRYGRVTVLDVQALRSLAARGIDTMSPRSEHPAARRRVDRVPRSTTGGRATATGVDAGHRAK